MSITLNDLCPCMQIELGEIDSCNECPYVPVYGENEAFTLKEEN